MRIFQALVAHSVFRPVKLNDESHLEDESGRIGFQRLRPVGED